MTIYLFNTLSKEKEAFSPLDAGRVRMYVCGPTVYDRAHIGNARAVVVFDVLYRLLCEVYSDSAVEYARNITDVDDKINARAKERNISIDVLTKETTAMFHADMGALFCLSPTEEPRATQHIEEMKVMIARLIEHGHAYVADKHVLFDVTSDANYGHLSRRSRKEMVAGARVEVAPYKKDPGDFVLWKPSAADEPGWESAPFFEGRGRPGWHIECSAMSTKYLGETFDIHGGGADLQFPHHENEIAQSCGANPGSQFARYWVHNGFLSVNGEKMSKSLGNFITVEQLLSGGMKGEVIRYVLLATHYHKPLDWTEKAAEDAKKALDSFYRALEGVPEGGGADAVLKAQFVEKMCDDLNTPAALAFCHNLAGEVQKASGEKKTALADTLRWCGQWLGLLNEAPASWLGGGEENKEIDALVAARNAARAGKNWAEADRIRDLLKNQNITLEDKPDGTTLWRRG